MANGGVHSNSSVFFITLGRAPHLGASSCARSSPPVGRAAHPLPGARLVGCARLRDGWARIEEYRGGGLREFCRGGGGGGGDTMARHACVVCRGACGHPTSPLSGHHALPQTAATSPSGESSWAWTSCAQCPAPSQVRTRNGRARESMQGGAVGGGRCAATPSSWLRDSAYGVQHRPPYESLCGALPTAASHRCPSHALPTAVNLKPANPIVIAAAGRLPEAEWASVDKLAAAEAKAAAAAAAAAAGAEKKRA
jgi:hypothetical protein